MYVLVLKDDLSGYSWLQPASSASSQHAGYTLTCCNRILATPDKWICDQGSHFLNETFTSMANDQNIAHWPTISYSPWTNGTVERLNRDIFAAVRALHAERKLAPQDWALVIPVLPSILNEAPLQLLGRYGDENILYSPQVMNGNKHDVLCYGSSLIRERSLSHRTWILHVRSSVGTS